MMDRILTALPLVPLTALALVMAIRHASSRNRELFYRRKNSRPDTATSITRPPESRP